VAVTCSIQNSIATVPQFEKALMQVEAAGLPESHLEMLNAQYRAPDRAISAANLAKAAGYKSYHGANLQYGKLAFNIAEALGYTPTQGSDGILGWWTTLSYSNPAVSEADTGHFQFIMRPELAKALSSLGWIRQLQNRVTPYGELEATSSKGTMMGNRWKLHDKSRRITKKWSMKRWIYCVLKCGEIHRDVMAPRSYTELFFLDEATALSAGHRPCSSCMGKEARAYRKNWLQANESICKPESEFLAAIDKVVHEERIDQDDRKVSFLADFEELSDGVFIEWQGKPYVILENRLLEWSHEGYMSDRDIPAGQEVKVLTPMSIVRYLKKRYLESGYVPKIHESAAKYFKTT